MYLERHHSCALFFGLIVRGADLCAEIGCNGKWKNLDDLQRDLNCDLSDACELLFLVYLLNEGCLRLRSMARLL